MKKYTVEERQTNSNGKSEVFSKKGFTLIELLTVITIIGILAGVILVSTNGAVDKAKRASALTTAASALPELVTCSDDGGFGKNSAPVAGNYICCTSGACTAAFLGHSAVWQNIASTGWAYSTVSGSVAAGTYQYNLTKASQITITCNMALNGCS